MAVRSAPRSVLRTAAEMSQNLLIPLSSPLDTAALEKDWH